MFLTENQKKSLFRLLADDDLSTISLVKQQLIEKGPDAVQEVEEWVKEIHGTPAERHLIEVLNHLQKDQRHTEFIDFCQSIRAHPQFDLEKASFMLASTEYPAVDMDRYRKMLDEIALEIRSQTKNKGIPSEIRAMSYVLHEKLHFRGNREHYYEAENTYLNRVLERKLGIPLTLSLLYILLGKRLGLQIQGVALPGHSIVQWNREYFDPFNYGHLLTEDACKQMVQSREQEFRPEHLHPATSLQILNRMLMNLARVYEIEEDRPRLSRIRKYLQTLGNV